MVIAEATPTERLQLPHPDHIVQVYEAADHKIEPFDDEIDDIDIEDLNKQFPWARDWAFDLEVLEGNTPNDQLIADKRRPLRIYPGSAINSKWEDNIHILTWNQHSPTQGIVLTMYDWDRIVKNQNPNLHVNMPVVYGFDEKRRKKALAERQYFLGLWNSEARASHLYELQRQLDLGKVGPATTPYPVRTHRAYDKFKPPEEQVSYKQNFLQKTWHKLFDRKKKDSGTIWIDSPAVNDFSYHKFFDENNNSRNKIMTKGLYTRLGKYIRSPLALGPMYDISGGVDAVVTAAMSGMLATIPRNGLFADPERQKELARAIMDKINRMKEPPHQYGSFMKDTWKRNVSVALATADPDAAVAQAQEYVDMGITNFKVFTISSNNSIVETCRKLREKFGDTIEIFAGQVPDKTEALKLIEPDTPYIAVDAICLGHGGGRQCTSAEGGMSINTVEMLDNLRSDNRFQQTTIMVEGGIGESPGIALLMGADGVFYFQKVMGTVIESPNGEFQVEEKESGMIGSMYRGEASVTTAEIESGLNQDLHDKHFTDAHTAKQVEGKWGFTRFQRKASSACHKIYIHQRYIAKMLADIGAADIGAMRKMLANKEFEVLMRPTQEQAVIARAYKNNH